MVYTTESKMLDSMAIILFGVVIVLPFAGSGVVAGASEFFLVCLLVVVLALRTGRLKGLKFGREGVEATMAEAREVTKEAREATKGLNEFMKITAASVLGLVKRTGRVGGYSYDEKEEIRREYFANLKELGISAQDIEEIEKRSRWHEYVAADYVYHILQGPQFPSGDAFTRGAELMEARELRCRPMSNLATPDELENFLVGHSMLSNEARELVADYRHYLAHHEQRRPEVWARRGDWYQWIRHTD